MRRISLCEGWLFRRLPGETPESVRPDALPEDGWEPVTLPHTWYTDEDQYRGLCAYRRTVSWEEDAEHAFLSFDGADQRCLVYADGALLGEHRGGYSRFRFPLERPVSGVSAVTVLLDNRPDEKISPHFGDFTVFGGLYRPAEMFYTGDCSFDYGWYGTDGLIVRASLDGEGDGLLKLEPHVRGAGGLEELFCAALDESGRPVAETSGPAGENLTLKIEKPKLWDGPGASACYTVRAELRRDGTIIDTVEIKTGFRRLVLSADKGLSLNGRKTPLHGVAKHQDVGTSFCAVSAAQIRGDFELIGEIGANAVRLSHYQHAQTAYEEADARGLLVWAEIPMLKMTEDPELFENAATQLRELILQNIHHPSVFCWGIQNEIAMFRDAPFMHEQCGVLAGIVRELDPDRFSACANLYPLKPRSKLNEITDLVGYNLYFGWYYGNMEDFGGYLDRFHAARPALPLGISEYGVDSNPALHSEEPHVKDYSEEYQALWHETVYPQIESRPWLWGSFVWNMFDFSSFRRNEGGVRFVNGKGLVTRDRRIRKDAFYYYRAKWSEEPFVHLCARRFEKRCAEKVTVRVYTNLPKAALEVNGTSFGTAWNDGNGTVRFEDVPLSPGENRVTVRSGDCEDSLVWQRVEQPEPSYALPDAGAGAAVKNWFLSDDDITRQGYFSVNDTANDVLENPDARAVLEKHVPQLVKVMDSGVIPLGLTVKGILSHEENEGTGDLIRAVNSELNQIENLF